MPISPQMTDDHEEGWSRRVQLMAIVGWSSFLAACLATLLFFAHFDPSILSLQDRSWLHFDDVMAGYALGFFFFWTIAAISSALAVFLLNSTSRNGPRVERRIDQ